METIWVDETILTRRGRERIAIVKNYIKENEIIEKEDGDWVAYDLFSFRTG